MNVRPLGDKILVKRSKAQDRTESGLYLPESAKDKPTEGKVVATGNGVLNKETGEYLPFSVKKGDEMEDHLREILQTYFTLAEPAEEQQ